jgi:two-component system chemotaxis response regulator CheY
MLDTILIADDSKAMRMIVKRVLRQAGFGDATIVEATNGAEALDHLRANSAPDLVLSDWNMPVMTGIELLQALRDEGISVPFGFVTSESTDKMREQALAAGALFTIAKPFTPDVFEHALGTMVT